MAVFLVITGFDCLGHAGYAEEGEDIVCAGISALVINTINSLGVYTKENFSTDSDEESRPFFVEPTPFL